MTRYRTGSHYLKIESGRMQPRIAREERLCKCNNDIQTLEHCLLNCALLENIRAKYNVDSIESGVHNADFLHEMERILELKC